ncbi:hypothetical protein [Streptomyces sp. CC228A]|uniref:hypothetical protein n=1 Tax=Streptomyces sp. CC228A TaxID=2898186 RepID=UPI001F3F1D2F|nr:hypothetical protein [Streptomyces sp. CC228A]
MRAYGAFAARASRLPPSVGTYALLLSLALDLSSGPSVLLDWRRGQREALLGTLEAVLGGAAWAAVAEDGAAVAAGRRLDWIRRARRQPFDRRRCRRRCVWRPSCPTRRRAAPSRRGSSSAGGPCCRRCSARARASSPNSSSTRGCCGPGSGRAGYGSRRRTAAWAAAAPST